MKILPRAELAARIRSLLRLSPVVALLGPRQSGKTTLARQVLDTTRRGERFDLEDPRDAQRLAHPMTALEGLRGLVVIDEVQRAPELFTVLRVLTDRRPLPARFLVLGSASPEMLRQSSETLAGRIRFVDLPGFSLAEVGVDHLRRRMLRGGFPRSYQDSALRGLDSGRAAAGAATIGGLRRHPARSHRRCVRPCNRSKLLSLFVPV